MIGQGCGSTAWVLANLAAHHWLFGMWHPEAQDEIWGELPDSLISSALIFARGRATRVPGGYRLSGRWPFSSGIDAVDLEHDRRHRQRRGERAERAAHVSCCQRATTPSSTPGRSLVFPAPAARMSRSADIYVPAYRTLSTERITGGPNRGSGVEPGEPLSAAGDQPVRLCHCRRVARHRARRDPAFRGDDAYPAERLYRQKHRRFHEYCKSISRKRRHWPTPPRRSPGAIATRQRGSPRPGSCRASNSEARYKPRRRLCRDLVHPGRRSVVLGNRRRRNLCTQPDPTRVSRRSRRQCPLQPELGRQRGDLWPGRSRPAARRAVVMRE